MRLAETVTFGGGALLNRHNELRGDEAALAGLRADAKTRFLPLWRGKPQLREGAGEAALELAPVGGDDPILAHGAEEIFLGKIDGAAWFAVNVSAWEPPDLNEGELGTFLDPSEQVFPQARVGDRFAELRRVMVQLSPQDAELAATAKGVLAWHAGHRFCARCGAPSVPSNGGWQRDCDACEGKHFPRTDPVVIMLITHGNSVLMGRSPFFPQGMYSLLAGFVEPGETIEAAVRREVFEEAGVRVGPVEYLASQPWPFPASLMIGCRGEATSEEIVIDPAEIEDAMWITREDMLEIFAGRNPDILPARKGAIAQFLLENWLADTLD
ncbi:NAD(+) diphosphatase [Alphaproteobacteria bacterium KMM 3653]|uniref:NAD(+) diphosphatase n=1 Tax=Harenicola maris TaxID=2841044 RepID=A0AAP2CSB2_9RHOB|nr:NAD(+) diphosphatase [Harenicola maris]